jgi:hypothetical protein
MRLQNNLLKYRLNHCVCNNVGKYAQGLDGYHNISKKQLRGTLVRSLKGGQMRFGGDNTGPNYLGRIEGQNGGGGAPIRNKY